MGIYYYKSSNYPLYLAHHGVKGMKWGVRHDTKPMPIYGAQYRYTGKYLDSNARAKKQYTRDVGAINKQRSAGYMTDSQYKSQMNAARRTKRSSKAEGKLNARKDYYSHVSQGRGVVGSVVLHVGGRKVSKVAQKKMAEHMLAEDGRKKVALYAGLMMAGDIASYTGAYGEYLETRRAIDKHKGRI